MKTNLFMAKKSKKILEENLPTLEEDVKDIKDKTMSPTVAKSVSEKADDILTNHFSGKKLEKMRKQLAKTMKQMQRNHK
jgi:hypothetical protein